MIIQRKEMVAVEDALLYATAYVNYVKNKAQALHEEADGTPSCETVLVNALKTMAMLSSFMEAKLCSP